MKLRDAFLSKMMVIALLGSSFVQPAGAADLTHEQLSHQEMTHEWAAGELVHSHHDGGLSPYYYHQDMGPGSSFYNTALLKHTIKKLAETFVHNPHQALDSIVHAANSQYTSQQNGMQKFKITIKYVKDMPVGDTTQLELVPTSDNSVVMQLTVHEAAKKNPFFLLDALVEVRNMYSLDHFTAAESIPVYHKKAHPSHEHKISHYHYLETSLLKLLGIQEVYNHQLTGQSDFSSSPLEYLEMRANADGGSIFSKRRLAEIEAKNFHIVKYSLANFMPMKKLSPELQKQALIEYAKAKGIALSTLDSFEISLKKFQDQMDLSIKKQLDTLNAEAKATYRQQVQAYKSKWVDRDVLTKTESLSEMIKANDRKGVADAMNTMLPWDIMEPTEKTFWSGFVEAIRHPNYDNAEILFRGLDADEKMQSVYDNNKKLIGGGLFSKRLTAGSGSHLFKLKGLPETFETFGTSGKYVKGKMQAVSPLTQPHTLTKMMINHSGNPAGSPFISLSYSLDTAFGFASGKELEISYTKENVEKIRAEYLNSNASGGLATIRIDPRRLIINSISGFTSELEVLASMFVFPDEVIYLEKGVNYSITDKDIPDEQYSEKYKRFQIQPADYYARAKAAVLQKTGIVMPGSHQELQFAGQKKFIDGIKNMETLFGKVSTGKPVRCEGVFK